MATESGPVADASARESVPSYTPGEVPTEDRTDATLEAAYGLIATGFTYPAAVDGARFVAVASAETVPAVARRVDRTAAEHLAAFLSAYEDIGVDEYLDTLELEPTCPPYLGHHVFDGPSTCRDIADADRNQFLVDLSAIYQHFDLELAGELADYLPAMVEFLRLSMPDRDDELRTEFMLRTVELLPAMVDAFESAGSPYWHLVAAFRRVVAVDLDRRSATDEAATAVADALGTEAPGGTDR